MDTKLALALARLTPQLPAAEQERIRQELEREINELITQRFDALVQALYRMDVDEHRLKTLLREHPTTDAARIIAALLIERHLQKLRTRQQFKAHPDIPEEEAW